MEAASAIDNRYYTEDEWIALERAFDTKFEYLDGYLYDVRAMAGGTITKLSHYSALSSLRDYVLVSLTAPGVIVYSRDSASASMAPKTYESLEENIYFPSLGVSIAMSALYDEVVFRKGATIIPRRRSEEDES